MHDLALPSSGDASGAGDACLFGLSLCSGAGGIDLGLTIAIPGYRAVGHVERETFAAATLVARMEDASLDQAVVWDDVATFDGRPWRGAVDIVTAGYPCQPFSVAGKRRGADDPRHLWPHVARIIGEVEPPFVFLENVAHHLRLGFPEVAAGLVGMGLSYDFPRLLCDKGVAARHPNMPGSGGGRIDKGSVVMGRAVV
ncbi:DNA cytosine methyltransferase [Tropicimonas isoalkanivorans]|uniref:C-5 cytosine-specific DNA methylase n=1 Tax=Tropicimonas isoalkanivorans TaxID=441112 RepID=A0A1I1FJR7_9RHOB|nr:DNA cytosine methyltransferase [Tropicimonas isoalkanivorans]SFB99232.1 C-5 cytosine-specific DNA methylase [Tropicimonas isoalkanivorans]